MTTGCGAGQLAVAGGPARHVPVLVRRVIEFLEPRNGAGAVIIDGTFGAGGYARAILKAASCRVIGIDRDASAVALGAGLVEQAGGRLTLVEGRFSNLDGVARVHGVEGVCGVVLDLGVSSMQLDTAERGFSFRVAGPLDMRMGRDGPSVADIVAVASERDLATIIATLGEERHARAVARAIAAARRVRPIVSTRDLADIVARVVRARPADIHPATRTFQALRMFANDELGELTAALAAAERILKPGGRLVVVSFHSLEDRIVKAFFVGRSGSGGGSRHRPEVIGPPATFRVLTRKPVVADEAEVAGNPRARSAKLRAGERTQAAPQDGDPADALPHLPSLAAVMRGA
jgi:16S rRNA (cytosine1402-N4)-methyltransferase